MMGQQVKLILPLALALGLITTSCLAIVKQSSGASQSSSSAQSSSAQSQPQPQQLSPSSSQLSNQGDNQQTSNVYNQQQSSSANGAQSQFTPYQSQASGLSSSASSQGASLGPISSSSNAFVGLSSGNAGSSLGSGSKPTYYDNSNAGGLATSASEQSYQAAANSVNMALANSGLFSSSSSSNSAQSANQQSAQASNQQQQQATQYQPVHYLYYPAGKDSGSGLAGPKSLESPSAQSNSNHYQYAAGNSYTDQLMGQLGGQPDVAASNQDPSYLPQPTNQDSQLSYQAPNQQHYGQQAGDLGAYANQLSPVQVSSQQPTNIQYQHQPNNNNQNNNNNNNAHLGNVQFQSSGGQASASSNNPSSSMANNINSNSDLISNSNFQATNAGYPMQASASQQHPAQGPSMNNNNNNNLFNQMGDLYTSNYGSPSISSPVAAYMPPNNNNQNNNPLINQQQHPQQAMDFTNQQQQQNSNQQPHNNNPMGLFGSQSNAQQQQQSSLFNNAAYLNSLLQSPQFASQFAAATGQGAADNQQQHPGQMMASGSQPAGSIASATAAQSKKFGLSSFIMPMLALAGLSLLVPTISTMATTTSIGRKKRSINDHHSSQDRDPTSKMSMIERQQQILYDGMNGLANQLAKESAIGEYLERIERYYSLYKNAAQNDDCMNRLICEFGDSVKDISGKSSVITFLSHDQGPCHLNMETLADSIIEKLVPNWMVGRVHLFKESAMDAKEGREKCKKYTCHHDKKASLH